MQWIFFEYCQELFWDWHIFSLDGMRRVTIFRVMTRHDHTDLFGCSQALGPLRVTRPILRWRYGPGEGGNWNQMPVEFGGFGKLRQIYINFDVFLDHEDKIKKSS